MCLKGWRMYLKIGRILNQSEGWVMPRSCAPPRQLGWRWMSRRFAPGRSLIQMGNGDRNTASDTDGRR